MAVFNACYCTREEVLRALDVQPTQIDYLRVDRAAENAREVIDALTHRRFFNTIETRLYDWPNYQYAYPWRIWFDSSELADTTVNVPVVTSGGSTIPSNEIFWGPWNYSPPFTYIELNRSTSAAFGVSSTPQQDVAITGTYGYWNKTFSGGTLAAAISSTTATTCSVSSSVNPGVGDVMIVDSESMLVMDRNWTDTTFAQSGSGCSTANNADNVLTTTGGTFYAGEVLLLDAEQVLILTVNASTLTVKRAFNGTVLTTHTAAEVYAGRLLTLSRGFGGTTAATHLLNAAINVAQIPAAVKTLAIAEAANAILQETSGYSHEVGESGATMGITGGQLDDLRDQVYQKYGRKSRRRVILWLMSHSLVPCLTGGLKQPCTVTWTQCLMISPKRVWT